MRDASSRVSLLGVGGGFGAGRSGVVGAVFGGSKFRSPNSRCCHYAIISSSHCASLCVTIRIMASPNTTSSKDSAEQPESGKYLPLSELNKASGFGSSAAQPASDSTAAELPSAISCESLLLTVRYVGAHNLETVWPCSQCNPYWYDWYCHE